MKTENTKPVENKPVRVSKSFTQKLVADNKFIIGLNNKIDDGLSKGAIEISVFTEKTIKFKTANTNKIKIEVARRESNKSGNGIIKIAGNNGIDLRVTINEDHFQTIFDHIRDNHLKINVDSFLDF